MTGNETIYINGNECTRCWRCIRECPVKAINSTPYSAAIDHQRCTGCGQCLAVCRYDAVRLRNDIFTAKNLIKQHTVKVASVSPQWVTEMDGVNEPKLVETLKLLGFTHVSETALGAEKTLEKELELSSEGEIISSRCPAVVSFIAKYSPKHKDILSPLTTPAEAHARMIKNWWGSGAAIVHFTVCAAEKGAAEDDKSLIDTVLTFSELKRWMREEGIESSNLFGTGDFHFEPYSAKSGNSYTMCGESGYGRDNPEGNYFDSPLQSVAELLRKYRPSGEPLWMDFMACEGGCGTSGASSCRNLSAVVKNLRLKQLAASRRKIDEYYNLPHIPIERDKVPIKEYDGFVAESETMAALNELGMPTKALQSDCNACGFGTCRRFAKALTRAEVEKEVCWYYLKHGVTKKLNTLISKLSSGVAIVNSSMQVEQANRMMATVIGPETEALFDSRKEGFEGVKADEIMPFAHLVASVLESGEESLVRDVQIGEKLITVSVHTVRKNRLVLVICRSMIFSQVRNEEIVKRTQKVINENLDTVRKIALLLGENASRTEAILNSILEANTPENV